MGLTQLRINCFILASAATLGLASAAFAHSAERGLVLLLPTKIFIIGGAAAVLASFILLSRFPESIVRKHAAAYIRIFTCKAQSGVVASTVSFIIVVGLIGSGFKGTHDPLANPLPLVTWTGWWVLFTLVQAVTGDLWKYLNPWHGPAAIARKLFGLKSVYWRLPEKTGYGFAIIQFSVFAWFELISISPEDPGTLAIAVGVFWTVNFIAVMIFGEKAWFGRGEPFSVFFRFVGAIAPVSSETVGNKMEVRLVLPGSSLLKLPALPWSGIIFVLLTLSTVSFDGVSCTFFWLGAMGINPLEFPGRSDVMAQNTIGMVIAFLALALVLALCIWFGRLIAGSPVSFRQQAGRLIYSIIPISIAFHFSHYLTQLLVNGQYTLLALNDPLSQGWNLIGIEDYHVTTSFLSRLETVTVIWWTQTIAVVIGHIVGIAAAHAVSIEIYKHRKPASQSQIFLAILMVGYTVFGLWLLSTASIG